MFGVELQSSEHLKVQDLIFYMISSKWFCYDKNEYEKGFLNVNTSKISSHLAVKNLLINKTKK